DPADAVDQLVLKSARALDVVAGGERIDGGRQDTVGRESWTGRAVKRVQLRPLPAIHIELLHMIYRSRRYRGGRQIRFAAGHPRPADPEGGRPRPGARLQR